MSANNGGGGSTTTKPVAAYCPYLPSNSYSSPVTISGTAYYQYRANGNGAVSTGVHTLTPAAGVLNDQYKLTINSHAETIWQCDQAVCTAAIAVAGLTSTINADSTYDVTASGTSTLILTPKVEGTPITIASLTKLTDSSGSDIDPKPIRYAELRVTNSSGTIIQCAETSSTGTFSFQLPSGSSSYTIAVLSRSNNSYNTAYILDTPTNNTEYSVSTTITASSSQTVRLLAKATGDLKGGAFNILDQILNAQDYLRTQTANCSTNGNANYFPDCEPFSVAPVVYTYWTAGLSPGVYVGSSGGISFYLNGTSKLYILGGVNGNTDSADMDHFDNSVIIHEYGHFIEDTYGRPDSPGGSHNGNSVIDPRLAWGEGWANFFQAAVLGVARYRDTYGHVDCSGCSGTTFDVDLDPAGTPSTDNPTASGEGNFREFSIARLLYDVVKSPGATSRFSEIWTVLRGPTSGFKVVSDRFKSIGRFHKIQQAITGAANWSALRTTEKHTGDLSNYATPVGSCSGSSSQAMAFQRSSTDNGSFSTSDQFRSNDFFRYDHSGGSLSLSLTWSGGDVADLDLYLYKEGYTFGSSSTMAAKSDATTTTTSGSESISSSLAAGTYLINVMAYTGIKSSPTTYYYTAGSNYNTSYTLSVNGSAVCPSP